MRTVRVIRAGFALGLLTCPLPVRAQAPAPASVQDAALAQTLRVSLVLDLPTGATIVCTFGLALAIMAAARPILHPRRVAD